MSGPRRWVAGIWEQMAEEDGGDGLVVWSTHSRADLARAAAAKYARQRGSPTGGALSWCGGYRPEDARRVTWVDAHNRIDVDARASWGAS